MTKKLHFNFGSKALNAFVFFVVLFFYTTTSFGQLTTIFTDDFNRGAAVPLSSGGTPSVNYTTTLSGIATSGTINSAGSDYRLQILNGVTTGTAGRSFSMAVMPTNALYNTTNSGKNLISWTFNMRHNRSQSPFSMSGFDPLQWGLATIIACDNANPTDATAKGYAVVMGGVGTKITYDLVSFSNGLIATANLNVIITGITLASPKNVVSIKVTFDPLTNKWNMYQKDEGSYGSTVAGSGTPFVDPSSMSVAPIGEVADTAGHVNGPLANFGFFFNHGTTTGNSSFFDNYKVTVGVPATTTYYLAANSSCSNLNNWWTGTNAASGSHPTDFSAAYQIFNIFNSGAKIDSDWTVNGSGSKVVLGNGTTPVSLTIPSTAFLNGKIDLAASSTLTISHLTTFPALNTISPTSSVIYNGTADQTIQGCTYGNLTINTVGIGNASGVLTASGNLTISSGSTLNMGVNKLLGVGTVSGTGALKTQYSSSSSASALPVDITWPFSVFYNSLTAVQSIVQGNYTNLDITGGGIRNLLTAIISVSGSLIADGVTCAPATSTINYIGTTPQTIGTVFPAFQMKIANSSPSGVSLTTSDIASITSATNLELAGNMSSSGFNQTFGPISLSGNSIISLGTGSHALKFPDCSATFWDPTKAIVVKGWAGAAGASGTAGQLFFGTSSAGLSSAQLAAISFQGYSNGCALLSTGELVPASLGIQIQNLENLKLFPNPVSNVLTISNDTEISEINVFNLVGQKIISLKLNTLTSTVDMSNLSPSAYIVEVISAGNKGTFKVIKK
jgi:hypothetical protein